ncbi:MAG: hypothetical protein JOY78_05605 [Pseudonocardia sp.]|nr:hypothetical protein [Pseudonocardia sp.]
MHLRPDRLRAHAADAAAMADALAKLGRTSGAAAEPVDTAITRARYELVEIEAALRAAAASTEAAEREAGEALRRAGGGP